jgi:asparagine synthase (glutamine-hydrolysing)
VTAVCGVCGTFDPGGGLDRRVAVEMHSRLPHRGPDETYSLDTATASMKLGRLAMTGVTDGWQPVADAGGRYLAMTNGEVYNADQLWARLGAPSAGNGVDVAVIPDLVARYGLAGLGLVDGQFATAVLDQADNALYLARDRFGICPMFYTVAGATVHFCSELKPLVRCAGSSWQVDIGAVDQYFALGNIVTPRTLVRGVCSVPPGCAVRFDADGVHTVRYWRYGEFGPVRPASPAQLREALRHSVDDRLRADVEIGSYLSGGFDSTAILVEAADLLDRPVRTFSVVFDDPALDERRFQQEVATAAGSKHEQVLCRPADVAARFEEVVRHSCYPQRETYNVAAMMLAEAVRAAGVKGVLSGEGADELFFGYDSYAFDSAARGVRPGRAENEQAWGRADFGWEVDWSRVRQRRAAHLTAAARESLVGQEFWRTRLIPFSDQEARSLSPMRLRSIADVYVQLSGHLLGDHGDAMLMASSVEGRYPFLGNSVVELALQVADEQKVVDFEGKACLKAAYSGRAPASVLRRAKHGFTAPDLRTVSDPVTWAGWRDLVAASGVLDPAGLDAPVGRDGDRWDSRLSAISISMVIDELGLRC